MAIVTTRKPRFTRVDLDGGFELTDRDIAIIMLVAQHRFIRSTDIDALLGGSAQNIRRRLEQLFHRRFLSRPPAQIEWYRSGSKAMVYSLGEAGVGLLVREFGYQRSVVGWTGKAHSVKNWEINHAVGVTGIMATMQRACQDTGAYKVLYLDEILTSIAPAETRKNPRPYFWSTVVTWNGKREIIHPIPDKTFAVQALHRPAGANLKGFFLEFDTGSQPIFRPDLAKSSIIRKYASYAETYRAGLHRSIYGFPNMRVLFVTSTEQRKLNMIEAHQRHTRHLCSPKLFLFADAPGLLAAPDPLQYGWLDGSGEQHRLLD